MAYNGRFSTAQVGLWMDQIAELDLYLALFSSDPFTVVNPLTVELVGGAYTRQASSWTRSSVLAMTLNAAAVFLGLPPGTTIAGVGGFDAPTNGNLVFRSLTVNGSGVPTPVSLPSGGAYLISSGQYVIGVDVPVGP